MININLIEGFAHPRVRGDMFYPKQSSQVIGKHILIALLVKF